MHGVETGPDHYPFDSSNKMPHCWFDSRKHLFPMLLHVPCQKTTFLLSISPSVQRARHGSPTKWDHSRSPTPTYPHVQNPNLPVRVPNPQMICLCSLLP